MHNTNINSIPQPSCDYCRGGGGGKEEGERERKGIEREERGGIAKESGEKGGKGKET